MELIENIQKIAPWAADLHILPKLLLTLLILSAAALFLSVIWTTSSTKEKESLIAIGNIYWKVVIDELFILELRPR